MQATPQCADKMTLDLSLLQHIKYVLLHWASPAGEIKLIPPLVFDLVNEIVETGQIPRGEKLEKLNLVADGVYQLLKLDRVQASTGAGGAEGTSQISESMRDLLRVSLEIARAALQSKTPCKTKPYIEVTGASEFETFIRTGAWFPNHRVVRTLPGFRFDYNNEMARQSQGKRNGRVNTAQKEARDEITEHARNVGSTCTKYKTSYRALTSGIFTVFCGGCGTNRI